MLADQPAESDPYDELFSIGLTSHLEAGTSLATVLALLRPPRDSNYFGGYKSFLAFDLPKLVSSPGLDSASFISAVDWANKIVSDPTSSQDYLSDLDRVLDSILVLGLNRSESDSDVIDPLAKLIWTNIDAHHGLVFQRGTSRPEISATARRELVERALMHASPGARSRPSLWQLGLALLNADDLSWLVESGSAHNGGPPYFWSTLISAVFDVQRRDHVDIALAVPTTLRCTRPIRDLA